MAEIIVESSEEDEEERVGWVEEEEGSGWWVIGVDGKAGGVDGAVGVEGRFEESGSDG